MTNDKEKKKLKTFFPSSPSHGKKSVWIHFLSPGRYFHQEKKMFRSFLYGTDIHELININIWASADGQSNHICLGVWRTTPLSCDWFIYLIGTASKQLCSNCHIVKITRRKKRVNFQINDISLEVKVHCT